MWYLCRSRWVAGRWIARPSQPDGLVEGADLGPGEGAQRSRALLAEPDRADRGAHQPLNGVADGVKQPADDVLAALVQHDLDHGTARGGVHDPERVHLDRA